jgi:hypothetical protein
MKRICFFLLATLFITSKSKAQSSTERIYIKGGNEAWENFMKEVYHYPSFENGIVTFKDGKQYKSNLNYNKVIGTIQFIDEKGDTLALSNEEQIKTVSIGTDVFFYTPSCMLELTDGGKFKLVKNERVRVADNQKVGTYGIPNSTGTITSVDRGTRAVFNQLDVNESILLNKTTTFYLELAKNELVPVSKKTILGMFPKHENDIKEYIKSKQINFTKEDDLVELTRFLTQL